MRNAILFGLMFLVIGPTTRAMLTTRLGAFGDWMGNWAPFSYIIIAVVAAAPVAAIHLMMTWPKHIVPESPMAKYRREAAMMDPEEF